MSADASATAAAVAHGIDARPSCWVGAPAPGGLGLPDALPTRGQLYAPRGVWLDERHLIVADTGNHRVLIWHGRPDGDHPRADVVLGQPDFTSEGAQAGGRGPERGMRLPTGVLVTADGRLVVADAWNHRLLVWHRVPEASDVAPDVVIGQADATGVEENRGAGCGPDGFWWPFGIAVVNGRFHVADTGNRRLLVWDAVPEPGEPPAAVVGQPTAHDRDENRGELGPASFRWVHDIAGDASVTLVADAGNHRILGWLGPPMDGAGLAGAGLDDRPADLVLGQPDFTTGTEFPYAPQSATALRFPYAISTAPSPSLAPKLAPTPGGTTVGATVGATRLAVADTANNRVLLWDTVPTSSGVAATAVLGQPDFAKNGENRWDAVGPDTFCWPYGLCLHGDRLAVADSGNNRVMLWELR